MTPGVWEFLGPGLAFLLVLAVLGVALWRLYRAEQRLAETRVMLFELIDALDRNLDEDLKHPLYELRETLRRMYPEILAFDDNGRRRKPLDVEAIERSA